MQVALCRYMNVASFGSDEMLRMNIRREVIQEPWSHARSGQGTSSHIVTMLPIVVLCLDST